MAHHSFQETEYKFSWVDQWWGFGLVAFGITCILFVALYYPTY